MIEVQKTLYTSFLTGCQTTEYFGSLKISKYRENLPSKNEFLAITLKNFVQADIKVFLPCSTFLDFLIFSTQFK